MGKELIIAEKPSLARNICAAIGSMKDIVSDGKRIGYENDKYIVTYAFGHLLSLCDAQDYNPGYQKWNTEDLPIIPNEFQYKIRTDPDGGVKKQLTVISQLINRSDVDCIINAGDSDREGEIIIRNILLFTGNSKPVFRLWMPDQTARTINEELSKKCSDSEYDRLAAEGYARTFIDWLYGINLTRLASIKANTLLRVGRVTTPIITAICERERAIRSFVKEKYYVAQHEACGIKLTSENRYQTAEKCTRLCEAYNHVPLTVENVKTEKKTLPRPKLLCLSDLQGICGKEYHMTPNDTLSALQELYEAKFVTYPRTDSRYMATAEKEKANYIIDSIKKAYQNYTPALAGISFRDSEDIFDDSKVETHSAITPTTIVPDLNQLSVTQRNVYTSVLKRFAAVFCTEEYTVNRTSATICNQYETFRLTGDVIITNGYTVFEKPDKKDVPLPKLEKGQSIAPDFKSIEKETDPPPHYTTDTLNKYLKSPYSKDEKKALSQDDERTKEIIGDVELGTEATRAGLIEHAIKDNYITLEKNRYGITEWGEYYVDVLHDLEIDMTRERTLNLSKDLKLVYHGDMDFMSAVRAAEEDLKAICSVSEKLNISDSRAASSGVICRCPRCGQNIIEKQKTFSCSNKDCGIVLYKEDYFLARYRKKITPSIAKAFFTEGFAYFRGLVSPKDSSKVFDAKILISFPDGKKYPEYKFDFGDTKPSLPRKESFAVCPRCGKKIIEFLKDNRTVYGCQGQCGVFIYKDANKFMETFGKKMTDSMARKLFAGESVFIEGFINPKDGQSFSHAIKLDISEKYAKIVWDT